MIAYGDDDTSTKGLRFDLHLDAIDTETLPVIQPYRRITLDPQWRGPWIVAGDVDGDGQCELVNARVNERNDTHPIASVCVYKLDGSILWRWGNPTSSANALHSDFACQIFDWNRDGRAEVVIATKHHLIALDGVDGKELFRHPIPENGNDSITFANLDGLDREAVAIIKNRYNDLWAMNRDGAIRWHWAPPAGERTAHQPYPIDLDGDGKEELIAGFCAIDGCGKQIWSLEQAGVDTKKGHLDCARVIALDTPKDARHLLMTLCSGNGIISVDLEGRRQWFHQGLHYESIDVGRLSATMPGPQLAVDTTHGKKPYQDPLLCIDATGRVFGKVWGIRVRQHFNVDWLGNDLEQIVIPSDRVIVDPSTGTVVGRLDTPQPVSLVPLKEEKARAGEHKNFGEYLLMGFCGDVTGNGLEDIVIHTNPGTCVWIYENTTGKAANRTLGTGKNYTLY